MTHYIFAEKKEAKPSRGERWETFAAFLTFTALVALAGATYGALTRGDVYAEVHDHQELQRFAGMLESTPRLEKELADDRGQFTIIAPTNDAFVKEEIAFAADDGTVQDNRIVTIEGSPYLMQGEAFVVRSRVMPNDVPQDDVLNLPTANGETITLSRDASNNSPLLVNGTPVRDRIMADNGVIYLVDEFIHPLPSQRAGE